MSSVFPDYLTAIPPFAPPQDRGPYRLADYLSLPEEPRVELINGRFYVSPAPIVLHQIVSMELSFWLLGIAKQSGGLALAAPCDLVLADETVVQPDLFYFCQARRPPIGARFESPPDLVIEILSPAHHSRDRVAKSALYARHGVAEYWIVDPEEQSVEFFVLIDKKYQTQPIANPVYQSPTNAELALDLPSLWKEIERQTGGKP